MEVRHGARSRGPVSANGAVGVAWGVYARSCTAVDLFSSACIGCADAHTFSVALVDDVLPPGQGCAGVTRTFRASEELSAADYARATSSDPLSAFLAKVRSLMR